ncbi:hypothetical protein Tco_0333969 [Tanacetum coccineum]
MITNNNRIEGKKSLGLMLPHQLKTVGTGYSLTDIIEAKPDKTKSGIGKSAKNRGQRYKRIKNGYFRIDSTTFVHLMKSKTKSKSNPGYGIRKSMEK